MPEPGVSSRARLLWRYAAFANGCCISGARHEQLEFSDAQWNLQNRTRPTLDARTRRAGSAACARSDADKRPGTHAATRASTATGSCAGTAPGADTYEITSGSDASAGSGHCAYEQHPSPQSTRTN